MKTFATIEKRSVPAVRKAYVHHPMGPVLQAQRELGFAKEGEMVVSASRRWDEEMTTAMRTGEAATGGEGNEALAVPIKVGDQTIAVLDAHLAIGEGTWTPERIELLDALSTQIGQALDRARLYEDTQRRAAREQLIGEVTGRVRASLEMETMLSVATSEIRRALGLDKVVVRLADPNRLPSEEV